MKRGSDLTKPVRMRSGDREAKPDRMAMNLKSTREVYKAFEIEAPDPNPEVEYRKNAKSISKQQKGLTPMNAKQSRARRKTNEEVLTDFQSGLRPIEVRLKQ